MTSAGHHGSILRPLRRYRLAAAWYDVISGEWPVYRAGRRVGLGLLGLRPGDTVLDVGCGTGLNFGLIEKAIGPAGSIVGVDLSSAMLDRAAARIRRHGWRNVRLVRADAGRGDLARRLGVSGADAVVLTYSLSVMRRGEAAWASAVAAARPHARVVVVDTAMPQGRWRWMTPLARLACRAGGVDLDKKPWRWVYRDTLGARGCSLRGGHVLVAAGTVATTEPDGSPAEHHSDLGSGP